MMTSARAQFDEQGFVRVERLLDPRDIDQVRVLLDPLFQRFESLPPTFALDHAPNSGGAPKIPDINYALRLEPRLRATSVLRKVRMFAAELVGSPVFCTFDHAIYKPPHNAAATPWHQDHAYSGLPRVPHAAHVWIPLQEATEANGCMWFIPGSHNAGTMHHEQVRGTKRTLHVEVEDESARAVSCPVPLGGVTAHGPLTLHMTGPNTTEIPRRAWILHFARFGRLALLHPANIFHRVFS